MCIESDVGSEAQMARYLFANLQPRVQDSHQPEEFLHQGKIKYLPPQRGHAQPALLGLCATVAECQTS